MSLEMIKEIQQLCDEMGVREGVAKEIYEMAYGPIKEPGEKTKIPCEVYSRVSGYFRPVQQWNNGKRQEFSERKMLNLDGTQSRGC